MVNLKWFNAPVVTLLGNMMINHQILGYHNSWNPFFDVIYLMDSFKNTCAYAGCRYYMILCHLLQQKKMAIVRYCECRYDAIYYKQKKKTWKNVTLKWVPWRNGYQNPQICYQVPPSPRPGQGALSVRLLAPTEISQTKVPKHNLATGELLMWRQKKNTRYPIDYSELPQKSG